MDVILVANEIVDSKKRSGNPDLIGNRHQKSF